MMIRRRRRRSETPEVFSLKPFGFVILTFALMISSTRGISLHHSIGKDAGKGNDYGRQNLLRARDNVRQDSSLVADRLCDDFLIQSELISNENSDQKETIQLVSGEIISLGTGNAARGKINRKKDRGLLDRRSGLRKLDEKGNETGDETLVPVNANTTSSEEHPSVGSSTAVIALTTTLGVVAILISVISWILVYIYRKNSLVAIGQPLFLYLICFGSILSSTELFFLFMDASTRDAACIAELWCRNIGSVCVHMAVFCKLWRAYKVAQFRKNQIVLPKHVIGPFVIMVSSVISFTIAQTIIDPPVWQIRYADEISVGMCLPATVFGVSVNERGLWIEITTIVLQLLSLGIMLVMAYVTRKIPEDISDSRRVLWAVATSILVSAIMYGLFWLGAGLEIYWLSVLSRSLRFFFEGIIFVAFLKWNTITFCYIQQGERSNTCEWYRSS